MSDVTARLRATAQSATEGPWAVCCAEKLRERDVDIAANIGPHVVADRDPVGGYDIPEGKRDAEFIATFDPVLVQAMLDVIDAAETVDATVGTDDESEWAAYLHLHKRLARFREVAG